MEWIVQGLRRELEALQTEVKILKAQLNERKVEKVVETQKVNDELIDTKEVLNYLGICYNTLQGVIRKGLLTPIRINQRRVKFSKQAVLEYVGLRKAKPA